MDNDASRDFLESLPELKEGESFCFDCNPEVPCFNRCCRELTLPLTPYDVLRLRRRFNCGSEDFLNRFTVLRSFPDTGFPLPMLRMLEGPDEACPFVSPAGCMVYEDRPGACRCYPLGRGAKMGVDGVVERFFLVREDHCRGFDAGTARTTRDWFDDQELPVYNAANDRYMRLMTMVRASGKPLEARLVTLCLLCLFQLDKFRDFIQSMRIFAHVDLTPEQQALILTDSSEGDAAALDFGLNWVELVIFGKSAGLNRLPT